MSARVVLGVCAGVTVLLVGWLVVTPALGGPGKERFLPGTTSPGHRQLEARCELCHTPFGGVRQEACTGCHGAALQAAADSHPASVLEDPRNAERLAVLDARRCVTCHREHVPEHTAVMGVTAPADFCRACHAAIEDERPSHRGLAFESCAGAGCHNFHDNRSLHEDFLARHLDEPDLLPDPRVPVRQATEPARSPPPAAGADPAIVAAWRGSGHERGGVGCAGCHDATGEAWNDRPAPLVCAGCHEAENRGFLAGKHGMALAAGLSPMNPGRSALPMRPEAAHRELTCSSCHGAHDVDTKAAAVNACLGCHADEHSTSYLGSPHHLAWKAERRGEAPPGSGVSCATCHLPRIVAGGRVTVDHDQNANLRPSDKMAAAVCGACHGMELVMNALADPAAARRSFADEPAVRVRSLEMVRQRWMERTKK